RPKNVNRPYESEIRGNFHFKAVTAITASVRLLTFSALRMALTWLFTVGSVRSSARQIALLLMPCITRASTSTWRSVNPRSAGEAEHRSAAGPADELAAGGDGEDRGSSGESAWGGMYMPPEMTNCSAPMITFRWADFGMNPSAPRLRALTTLSRS